MSISAKNKRIASLVVNLGIVVMELVSIVMSAFSHGAGLFRFYTEDSNIFALIACAALSVCTIAAMKNGGEIPKWAYTLKYMATCCLMVTFIVVITVLAPPEGLNGYIIMMLSGSMLFHHFLCPVLALISLIFFDNLPRLPIKTAVIALVPTIIYATAALILNAAKLLYGPYPFLHIYEQPLYMTVIWCVVIIGGAALVAVLLRLIVNKLNK